MTMGAGVVTDLLLVMAAVYALSFVLMMMSVSGVMLSQVFSLDDAECEAGVWLQGAVPGAAEAALLFSLVPAAIC